MLRNLGIPSPVLWAEQSYAQSTRLSLELSNATISDVFASVEKNSEYRFFYSDAVRAELYRNVDVNIKNKTIDRILSEVLDGTNLTYFLNDRQVMIIRKEEKTQQEKKISINGTVRDAQQEPLPGVNVLVKGTTIGTTTDIDGNYFISVPDKNAVLVFSYIGFESQEVKVGGQININVNMSEESNSLDEVVVVGYGSQKRASVVGSITAIEPAQLQQGTTRAVSNNLAGQLAGVIAVQRNGEPGSDGSDFWIRGISTFNGTRSPLIIIDGVQASSGDLNAIDPEVIESFSVLKDATATALYGSRGANGVMIVKTKSGRESDKAIVNIRLENAYSTHTKTPKFVDGVRYMEMYNEAVLTRGTGEVLYSDNKIAGTRAGLDPLIYPNVNWYDELFRSGAMNQNINVTIRGGSKKLDYFSSVSVNHDSGVLRNTDDFSYKNNLNIMRYVFQNNFNLNLSKSSKLSLNLNVQLRDYSGPTSKTSDLFGMVMESNPVDFPVRFPDDPNVDYIRWGGKSGGKYNSGFRNPYAEMARGYQSQFESTVMANLKFEQKLDFLTEGLSAEALFSFKNWSYTNTNRSAGYNQFQVINYNADNLSDYTLNRIGSEQSTVLNTDNS